MIKFLKNIGYQFREYILLIVLVLICIILISASEKPQAKRLKAFAIANIAFVYEFTSSVVSVFTPDDSVEELKSQNALLMLQVNKMKNACSENEELRGMLSLKDSSAYSLLPVKVISKLVNKVQGNFIINYGSADGIVKGMPVISHKGLVGMVMDVMENSAVVRSLYNTSLNIAVTIDRIKTDGILTYNGRNLIIKNIPTTYDVQIGDKVSTSDFSSLFPPSIPIGVIYKKDSNVLGLLHNLTVEPNTKIEAVKNLFVVKIIPSKQINQLELNLIK